MHGSIIECLDWIVVDLIVRYFYGSFNWLWFRIHDLKFEFILEYTYMMYDLIRFYNLMGNNGEDLLLCEKGDEVHVCKEKEERNGLREEAYGKHNKHMEANEEEVIDTL